MKKLSAIILCAAAMLLLAVSCDSFGEPEPEPSGKPYSRVLIMVEAGFNSLNPYIKEDIKEFCGSSKDGFIPPKGSNRAVILVSHLLQDGISPMSAAYRRPTSPVVERISRDHLGRTVRDTIKVLPSGTNLMDRSTLNEILTLIRDSYRSDSYGLLLSSHGTGWLPAEYYARHGGYTLWSADTDPDNPWPDGIPVKTFGQGLEYVSGKEISHELSLQDLAAAIPMKMDYILFDACLMGGIETAYELRDVADVIGFSQAEVAAEGFAYSTLAKRLLCESPASPEAVCQDYFEACEAESSKVYQSATISLVDCSRLEPLAALCRELFEAHRDGLAAINHKEVQGYFRQNKHWFYDLEDVLIKAGISAAEHQRLSAALEDCMIYRRSTPRILDDFDVRIFSGFSMYLPCNGDATLDDCYRNLAWNKATSLVK